MSDRNISELHDAALKWFASLPQGTSLGNTQEALAEALKIDQLTAAKLLFDLKKRGIISTVRTFGALQRGRQVILTMAQQSVVDRYRATGHCASFNPLDGHITLHGYRRYTPDAAIGVMEFEMDPEETQRRVNAAAQAIRESKSE